MALPLYCTLWTRITSSSMVHGSTAAGALSALMPVYPFGFMLAFLHNDAANYSIPWPLILFSSCRAYSTVSSIYLPLQSMLLCVAIYLPCGVCFSVSSIYLPCGVCSSVSAIYLPCGVCSSVSAIYLPLWSMFLCVCHIPSLWSMCSCICHIPSMWSMCSCICHIPSTTVHIPM